MTDGRPTWCTLPKNGPPRLVVTSADRLGSPIAPFEVRFHCDIEHGGAFCRFPFVAWLNLNSLDSINKCWCLTRIGFTPDVAATRVFLAAGRTAGRPRGKHVADLSLGADGEWSLDVGVHVTAWTTIDQLALVVDDFPAIGDFRIESCHILDDDVGDRLYGAKSVASPLGVFENGFYVGVDPRRDLPVRERDVCWVDASLGISDELLAMCRTAVRAGDLVAFAYQDDSQRFSREKEIVDAHPEVNWGESSASGDIIVWWRGRPCQPLDPAMRAAALECQRRMAEACADGGPVALARRHEPVFWQLTWEAAWARRRAAVGACWLG